jgi:hypothetical protein
VVGEAQLAGHRLTGGCAQQGVRLRGGYQHVITGTFLQ